MHLKLTKLHRLHGLAEAIIDCLEHAVVLTLEGARRFLFFLDPKSHFESLRVKSIDEGGYVSTENKVVIFVLYCSGRIPSFTKVALEAFARAGFNVVAVLNRQLCAEDLVYLKRKSRLIVHRRNVGRDFGGYKDAIWIVLRQFGVPDRLILANDSVYFLNDGLAETIAKLEGPQDFVGVSEVLEHHYHVGSYLLSFSRKVVESYAFKRFWRRYKPLTTRRWAIQRGEGTLTSVMIGAGFLPKVLFRADHLRGKLVTLTQKDLMELLKLLPSSARLDVINRWRQSDFRKDETFDAATAIIEAIVAANQIHVGGFLFRRFLGLPIIKRDIVFRELYSLEEARSALSDLSEGALEDVLADLSARGSNLKQGFWRRLLYRHDAI